MNNKSKQEEKTEAYMENRKEKSALKIRIVGRIIRLIIPIFFPFLYAIIGNVILYCLPALKDDFGVIINIFCIVIFVPIYCIVYGYSVAKNEKRKYIFALYNPMASCWFYFLDWNNSFYFFSLVWISFWTFVPIWISNQKHEGEGIESSSIYKMWKAIKKILYLFVIFFISSFFQSLAFSKSVDSFWGSIILLLLYFVLFPVASFYYSKVFVSTNEKKWIMSVICPVFLVISFNFGFPKNETFVLSLALFVWCEVWSLIGLNQSVHD